MKRERVRSSNIESIGYEPGGKTLEIEFKDGGIYQYVGVPEGTYAQLMGSHSKGRFFHQYIKDTYQCRKVR